MTTRRAAAAYRRAFGADPEVIASAPGRVNLIGEHVDYNGGDVLPMGLALRTAVAIGPSKDGLSHAVSESSRQVGSFAPVPVQRARAWWDYVAGTVLAMQSLGAPPRAMQVAVASDVPSGAGLSSSAALEVATAHALSAWSGVAADPTALALAAHRAETEFAGVPCGIMDQFASSLSQTGQALLVACDRGEATLVPMRSTVLVFDTRTPRALRDSAFQVRRAECDEALLAVQQVAPDVRHLARAPIEVVNRCEMRPVIRRRALHVVRETLRVSEFVRALRQSSAMLGDLLFASHASLRDDYECSSPELDWFVERAREASGVTGARLTGAGWGGCAIATGEEEPLRKLGIAIAGPFGAVFGRRPRYWLSRAGDGARIERGAVHDR